MGIGDARRLVNSDDADADPTCTILDDETLGGMIAASKG